MEYTTIVKPDGTIQIVPVDTSSNLPFNVGGKLFDQFNTATAVPNQTSFDPRSLQSIFPTNVQTGIMTQAPLQNLGFDTSFGVANEEDVEQEFLPGQEKSGGIADLFRALFGFFVPGANLLMGGGSRALQGIKSLNQRLRNTDFAKSKTLVDYLEKRRRRKETDFLGSGDSQGDIITYDPAKTRNRQRIMNMQPTNRDTARGSISFRSSPTTSRRDTSPSSSYSQASYDRRR